MAVGFLIMWVVFVLLVNQLARKHKHQIGWTVAASLFPLLLIVLTGSPAQMSAVIVLFIWAAHVALMNHLARGKKHRIGWTVAAAWFGLVTFLVFLTVEAISRKRQAELDAGEEALGGQLRS